jgi:succinate dehydrogenase / fumarate reductase cytochrome b subunit
MMYRWRTGGVAWLLHRLSGLALAAYLPLHVWVNHHLSVGPERYDEVMRFLHTPLFRVLECGLWGVILYHALNGVRVVLIDLGIGVTLRGQKVLFWAAMVLAAVFWVWGSVGLVGSLVTGG